MGKEKGLQTSGGLRPQLLAIFSPSDSSARLLGVSGLQETQNPGLSHPQLWPLATKPYPAHLPLELRPSVFLRRLMGKMRGEGRNRARNVEEATAVLSCPVTHQPTMIQLLLPQSMELTLAKVSNDCSSVHRWTFPALPDSAPALLSRCLPYSIEQF